ncbi:MAG: hypothetical protein SOW20_08310 [Berryella intestinalis]|uniref:hypothetical protein n=1 Tax=Berryella intestinalis TaxID=1531429 RepID=UPI002A75EF6B|nr:hypothetical protein [Berryella intestinalis]MDY3130004.1 hypothetical protein [Berryella intestinalis]
MRDFSYTASDGERIDLSCESLWTGAAVGTRGHEWGYSMSSRSMSGIMRKAREVDIPVATDDRRLMDAARRAFDRDLDAKKPGLFRSDGWEMRGYVVAFSPSVIDGDRVAGTFKAVFTDGAWTRLEGESVPVPSTADGADLDYPHDYPHDFAPQKRTSRIRRRPGGVPADVRLVVYGPASNPSVSVAGNVYSVRCSVPAGGYLVVDGRDKTVELVAANGDRSSRFADAERGSGRGSGRYVFERVPCGDLPLDWDGTFAFDFLWYEEEGEPPWSR